MRIHVLMAAVVLATVTGVSPQDKSTIVDRQAAFLRTIQGEKIKEAYDILMEGSRIPHDREADVEILVKKTEQAIAGSGRVSSIEDLGIVRQDKQVAWGLAIVCCEVRPVFFYFVWYRNKPDAPWHMTNVWFDTDSKNFLSYRK